MKYLFLVLISSIAFLGCAGMDVKRDYDTAVDFHRLKTFAWTASQATDNGLPDNSLMEARVSKAVDSVLTEKGYRKTTAGESDCLVTYRYDVEHEAESDRVHTGVGLGGGGGGLFGGVSLGMGSGSQETENETLTINILDSNTKKLIWSGSKREQISNESDPDKITSRIKGEVKAILSKFPPK